MIPLIRQEFRYRPVALAGLGAVAELLEGHRAVALQRAVGAPVVGDARIRGNAGPGDDQDLALIQHRLHPVPGFALRRRLGLLLHDALHGSDRRVVRHLDRKFLGRAHNRPFKVPGTTKAAATSKLI